MERSFWTLSFVVRWLVVPLHRQGLSLILTTWTTGLIKETTNKKSETNRISAKNSSRLYLHPEMLLMTRGTLSSLISRMNVREPHNLMLCGLRHLTGLMMNFYQKRTRKKLNKRNKNKNMERKSSLTIRKPSSSSRTYRVNWQPRHQVTLNIGV